MKKFISLTFIEGNTFVLNKDHIISFFKIKDSIDDPQTLVNMTGEIQYIVKEPPAAIKALCNQTLD